MTYAVASGRSHVVDYSIAELERKLDPKKFVRIHRATLLNLEWVEELNSRFGGQVVACLKDEHTRLDVARDRVRVLKERLEL